MKGKLLIVDDEYVIHKGLSKMVEACPITWTVVGEAEHGMEAMALIGVLAYPSPSTHRTLILIQT